MTEISGSVPPPAPANAAPAVLARKRAAATMLITDPAGRLLVVDPTYKPRWELPGGAVEADESPAAAAHREVVEELGLSIAPGRLLALDYVPAEGVHGEGLIVVFDGGELDDLIDVVLPPDELGDAAFVDVEDLDAYLPALQARRARAALAARATGTVAYLEDGHPPRHRPEA